MQRPKKNSRKSRPTRAADMVESVVGCKWSVHVLGQIRRGVRRPGALVRTAPGLTAKVLNERLRKMQRYGVLDRRVYPVTPPRVEYHLTAFGRRFVGVLDLVEELQAGLDRSAAPAPARRRLSGV